MSRRATYTLVLLIMASVVLAVFAWSVFLGKQTKALQLEKDYSPPGYLPSVVHSSLQKSAAALKEAAEKTFHIQTPPTATAPPFVISAREIVAEPVAGFGVVFQEQKENRIIDTVFYTLIKNGHTFFATIDPQNFSVHRRRVLQSTIPAVQRAFLFGKDLLWRQYADPDTPLPQSLTTVANIVPQAPEQNTARPEAENITAVAQNDQGIVAYLEQTKDGVRAVRYDPRTGARDVFWSSFLRDWNLAWLDTENVLLWQKPAHKQGSALFRINTTKTNERILTHRRIGLSVLPLDANRILLSEIKNNTPQLSLLTIGERPTETPLDPPVYTFAEKCVGDPDNRDVIYCFIPETMPTDAALPDAWLQGAVAFTDRLWEIHLASSTRTLLYPTATTTTSFTLDATHVTINPSATAIYTLDKTTGRLWRIDIKPPYATETNNKEATH